jgi:putative membrane protein
MLIFDLVPSWGRGMGALLLILQGSVVGLWLARECGARGVAAAALILALSYLVEWIGVTSGIPFGHYAYTPVLGLQLGGAVPLAIPFAWLMVVPGARLIAARLRRAAAVLTTACLALLLDLLIEPVATQVTGYWRWIEQGSYYGVPAANFVAWGATALALAALLDVLVPELRRAPRARWLPPLLFTLNALQFTLVDAAYGFWLAAVIGVGLLFGIYALWRPRQLFRRIFDAEPSAD